MIGRMECLALAPLKFTVWSSDFNLIRTNVFVNAHPKATVARLLQYVHSQLYAEYNAIESSTEDSIRHSNTGFQLGHVSEYCIYYRSKELPLDTILQDVEPMHGQGFIRLQLENRKSQSGSAMNLDYDLSSEFATTNLQLNVNALSVDKIMSVMENNISMGITMARLQKIALQRLYEYESHESRSLCGLKERHTPSDFIGFIIKGKQTPTYLNDENSSELYHDLTLSELLGFDFVPERGCYFTVMFKIRHNVDQVDGDDAIKVEFISDATLSINEMSVTPDTTVEQVKDFICSVYTHSLSLSANDIKLIYKGQLVHASDFAGNASKMMEYINEPGSAKIHVHISQEFNEPGPGFWSELFNNSETFEFMNSRAHLSDPVSHVMLPSSSSRSQTHSIAMTRTETSLSTHETDRHKYKFVTESGLPLRSSNEIFVKCLLNGSDEIFVPAHELDPFKVQLKIGEHSVSLSSMDYIVENGLIRLSPNVISKLESNLHATIMKNTFSLHEMNPNDTGVTSNSEEYGHQRRRLNPLPHIANLFPLVLLVFRTLYLIGNYSIIPLFFLMRLSALLPRKYIILIAVLYILRAIWSTREIWDIWSNYLNLNVISEDTYAEIKNYVSSGSLSSRFYEDCRNLPAVSDILMASNLRELRSELYENYHVQGINEDNTVAALNDLFKRVHNNELPKEPMDNFILNSLNLYENSRDTIPASYLESLKELLLLAYRDMGRSRVPQQLPWYQSIARTARHQVERFRQSQVTIIILEHIVPNPREDNIPLAIIKNLVLFFLILLPPVKNYVDIILQERARFNEQQERNEEQERREHVPEAVSELEPESLSEFAGQSTMASGIELHDENRQ